MKNIAIFSDGTCKESDKGYVTNVYKLYQAVQRRTPGQLAFYDPGVGTDLMKLAGAAFGVGISTNIQQCYEFLMDVYQPGDRIFLFGFSRGAYTVRSLAGMVHFSGLLKREYRSRIEEAFKLYKKKNDRKAEEFKRRYCWGGEGDEAAASIYFIGVWDTVSALGIPFSAVKSLNPFSSRWYGFHDATLHKEVKFGYQALSIDDQRKVFKPELWDESHVAPDQTVEQLWFAGVHSNVGGGYRRAELSDITLQWMIDKAGSAGLLFWEHYKNRVLMFPDANGKLYDSRARFGKLYVRKLRDIPDDANIHQSVFDRIENRANLYAPKNLPSSCKVCSDSWPPVCDR